jgi:hypothetical protein
MRHDRKGRGEVLERTRLETTLGVRLTNMTGWLGSLCALRRRARIEVGEAYLG